MKQTVTITIWGDTDDEKSLDGSVSFNPPYDGQNSNDIAEFGREMGEVFEELREAMKRGKADAKKKG